MKTFCSVKDVAKPFLPVLLLALAVSPVKAHQPHDPLLVIAMSPNYANDKTLLLATDYLTVSIGVYLPLLSTDGGNTLTPVRGVPNQPSSTIEFSPNYAVDKTILIGGAAGLYMSTNQGLDFSQVTIAGGAAINSVDFSPNYVNDSTIFAVSNTGVFVSKNRAASFAPVTAPGPLTGTLSVISLSPTFSTDSTILVGGTSDGIFRSTNAGSSWTNQTQSQTLAQVQSIVFPDVYSTDHSVFVGTYGTGVFISTNSGTTFTTSNSGISDLNVSSLITYPGFGGNSTLLISTATAGVFVSTNAGASWSKAANVYRPLSNQTTDHYRVLAAAKTSTNTATIFLGMFEGLWESTNKAQSWNYVDMLPTYLLRELRVSPTYPVDQTVLGTSYGGGQLYSNNGGAAWSFRNTSAQNAYPDADAISPNYDQDQTFFVGDLNGLEISTNQGASWKTATGLNATTYVRGIGVSPNIANDGIVLIGSDNRGTYNPTTVTYEGKTYSNQGLFISTNRGSTWVPTSLSGPPVEVVVMSPQFATDQTAFAVSAGFGLYESKDGGKTWAVSLNLDTDPGMLDVAVSPSFATDHTAFAATPHSGIYKTTNGGMTWSQLINSTPYTAISFAISPNFVSDQTLFIGTFQTGLVVSTNGGDTFQQSGLTQNFVTGLAISSGFATDGTIFASTYRGVYKSVDGGNTWSFTDQPNRQENDRQVNIIYGGTWTQQANPSVSTDDYQSTTQTSASATVEFFGTQFTWLGLTSPKGGTASVTVDGVAVGTASFKSAALAYQQPIFQQSGLTCAPHIVVFTASTTASQAGINFDAIDASRSGCGY